MHVAPAIELSAAETRRLAYFAQSNTVNVREPRRAEFILRAATDWTNQAIAAQLGINGSA